MLCLCGNYVKVLTCHEGLAIGRRLESFVGLCVPVCAEDLVVQVEFNLLSTCVYKLKGHKAIGRCKQSTCIQLTVCSRD